MKIAVVIPCYKVKAKILSVLSRLGPEVSKAYIIDDACPEGTGRYVEENSDPNLVQVIYHQQNQGVGGAVISGYRAALKDGFDVVVKVDGDGQMNPQLIPRFIAPITEGRADYTKGNRFFSLESLTTMPPIRVFGNSILSFLCKISSGYWNLMDPTNGFTAIHSAALLNIPLEKLDSRYFFETDLLFRLNTIRAVVEEVPMNSVYEDEKSNLSITKVSLSFPSKFIVRFFKRIFYNYFLRDFNVCSLEIVLGSLLMSWGILFGGYHWFIAIKYKIFASSGTVMLAGLPFILGFQLVIAAVSYDVMNIPKSPLQKLLQLARFR